MNIKKTVIIRADASHRMGIGHIMRCVAFAQGLVKARFKPLFVTKEYDDTAYKILSHFGFRPLYIDLDLSETEDAMAIIEVAADYGADLVVVDHYGLKEGFRRYIKKMGLNVLVFDDNCSDISITADILINQNIGADLLLTQYQQIAPEAKLFILGERFTLLREDVIHKGSDTRKIRKKHLQKLVANNGKPSVLITFGGTDVKGLSPVMLKQLKGLANYYKEIFVACGPGMSPENLKKTISLAADVPRTVVVENPILSQLMSVTDVAITAGGSAVYELAYFGIPMLIIEVAENQDIVCKNFAKKHLADVILSVDLTEETLRRKIRAMLISPEMILQDSEKLMATFDAKGCERIIDKITHM